MPFLRQGGPALVVFDGLDEVFDPRRREEVTRQIDAFAARYPQARVIVTSRPVGYQRAILDAAGFAHYMLQDLDLKQIRAFTTAWYRASWPGNPAEAGSLNQRLLRAVEHSAAVAELAGNPLLLTILAIIGRRRELPRERRNVYEHAVSVLVEHWDATGKHLSDVRADGGMPYLEYEDKLELLHLVARHMQDGPAGLAGNYIAGQDLRHYFDTFLRDRFELPPDRSVPAANAMLGQLRERNFILARFGGGAYGFVHRVFLEYLAADDIRQQFSEHKMTQDELLGVFGQHWNDPAWQEVLLLVTGMISEAFAAKVIDQLLAADPLWYLRPDSVPRHVVLALGCLGEVRKLGGLTHQATLWQPQ
jgi:predicted NACHT family NTPase